MRTDHRQRIFRLYLTLVIALGVAIFVLGLVDIAQDGADLGRLDLVVLFFGLVLAADVRPISWLRRREGAQVTANLSYQAALLFVASGLAPAVLAGAASLVGDLMQRRPPHKVAFNTSMTMLSVAAAAAVLDVGNSRLVLVGDAGASPRDVVVMVFALVALFLTNGFLVLVVVSLNEGSSLLEALRRDLFHSFSTDGVLLAMGPVMVLVAAQSLALFPALLLLNWTVFSTAKRSLERLHEATHDSLTGLPNRRMFRDHLDATSRGGRVRGVVAIIDLDGFKEVNDRLGHDTGDLVLIAAAERLRGNVGDRGLVARLGGDEFAVLLPEQLSREVAHARFVALHASLCEPLVVAGFPVTVGGSVGAAIGRTELDTTALMQQADLAMYTAKSEGGGVVVAPESGEDLGSTGRLGLLADLERATGNGEIDVHYQPIVSVEDGRVELEALVRWVHPQHGMVPPSDFIPLAEQTDLIRPLTDMVIERAVGQLATWRAAGHDVRVAVNLSARSLQDLRLARRVAEILESAGVDGTLLTLEITENAVLADPSRTERVLDDLRALGVRFAIDDFGTGHSSLVSLRDLPVDVLKVDGRFVRDLLGSPADRAIVHACIGLARQLGLQTVAEWVEDEATGAWLAAEGCDALQGYAISRPLPHAEATGWLEARRERSSPPVAELGAVA